MELEPSGLSDSTHRSDNLNRNGGNIHRLPGELEVSNPQIEKSLRHNQGHSHTPKMQPPFSSPAAIETPSVPNEDHGGKDRKISSKESMLDQSIEGEPSVQSSTDTATPSPRTALDTTPSSTTHYGPGHVSKFRPAVINDEPDEFTQEGDFSKIGPVNSSTQAMTAKDPIQVTSNALEDDRVERYHHLHTPKVRPYFENPQFDEEIGAEGQGDANPPTRSSHSGPPRQHSLENDIKGSTEHSGVYDRLAEIPGAQEISRGLSDRSHDLKPLEEVS